MTFSVMSQILAIELFVRQNSASELASNVE